MIINKLFKIAILFLMFLEISCKDSVKIEEEVFLKNAIVQINSVSQYNWIVILPGLGCHGCIQEGEYFMKKNIEYTKILFVLTNISSLKIFQQKTGIQINKHSNIYIDRNNHFRLPTQNAIYPCIIQISNGNLFNYSFQSPTSASFLKLKKNISKRGL